MQLDCLGGSPRLRDAQALARDAERAGFDGLWFTESGRTAYLPATAAVLAADRITVGTGIAVAFPRSPMITAKIAWELAEASEGRFVLGLGSQVKAHIERRYGSAYGPPGPRMREYVRAVRAIFRAFQGEQKLDFRGEYWSFDLLPEQWSPGPIAHPDVPIYVAAVRPWMLRMAGELCDGVHVHPFHSRRYIEEVVRPNVAEGARRAGRALERFVFAVPVMTIVGDSDEERERWRTMARFQIAFYGSTRTYAPVFELHGWEGVSQRLHALMREGRMQEMAETISDEMLDVYTVTATWDGLADALVEKYDGLADRLILYFAARGEREPGWVERWNAVVRSFEARVAARA